MKSYEPEWDLRTIPDKPFKSERARRQSKARTTTTAILKPCTHCGKGPYNATQRRRCPNCGHDERSDKGAK